MVPALTRANKVDINVTCGKPRTLNSRNPRPETDMTDQQGRFVWYELMTTDVEAAKVFYGKVVGWGTRQALSSPYTLFTAGEASAVAEAGAPARG